MLKPLIGAFLAGESRQLAARAKMAAICSGLAALCLLAVAGFLISAGFMLVAARIGSLEAALLFGAGFLAIALILIIANAVARRIAQRRRRLERASEWQPLAIAAAVTLLPGLARSKVGLAALL